MIKRNVNFVGNYGFDTYVNSEHEVENEEELEAGIYELCTKSDLTELHIYPNFKFGWLCNSSGFAASLPLDNIFHGDIMIGEKFRVIMAAEVQIEGKVDKNFLYEAKKNISKFFPMESSCPPTPDDNFASGWHPALGKRGSCIGIYHTLEHDINQGHKYDRYYIVCHTSLPEETLQFMNEYDRNMTQENQKMNREFDWAGVPVTSDRFTYVKDAFSEHSLNKNMLEIAIENARRLIVIYADILDLTLYNEVSPYSAADLPADIQKAVSLSDGGGLQYKKIIGIEGKMDDEIEIKEALKLWGPGIPMEGFSKLPHTSDIPDKFRGYPIGNVLMEIGKDTPELLDDLNKKFGIELRTKPRTVKEDIVSDYNTYRKYDNQIVWYSNSTPTFTAEKGVIISDGLENGFTVINQNFMFPRKGEIYQNNYGMNNSGKQFNNLCQNGYPVVWPFRVDKQRKIQDTALNTFFDFKGTPKPLQLLGTQVIDRNLMSDLVVKDELKADFAHGDSLKLTPVTVLLSNLPLDSPTYELK